MEVTVDVDDLNEDLENLAEEHLGLAASKDDSYSFT
jgi:hypothetical protein